MEPLKLSGNFIEITPKRKNKYEYWLVIQQNYGQGWEDVSQYEADSSGTCKEIHTYLDGKKESLHKHDLREYKFMGYQTRVIFRKEKNTNS